MKALSLTKPHLLVMVGIPGSGKSFFAKHFSDTFKAPWVHLDGIRAELFNEPTFSKDENIIVSRVSDYMLDEVFKTQKTILLEGGVDQRTHRTAIEKRARAAGYETLYIWVQTDPATAKVRATKKTRQQPVAKLSSEQFDAFSKRFTPLAPSDKQIVISGKHTFASQIKIVLKKLVEPRAEAATTTEPKPVSPTRPASSGRTITIS